MLWNNLRGKQQMREFVLPHGGVNSAGIWLPAEFASCILTAERFGKLKNCKRKICIEKKHVVYCRMLKALQDNNVEDCYPYCGDLSSYVIDFPVDYCFLDFKGGINKKLAIWMNSTLSPNLQDNSTVAITHMLSDRNNKFLKKIELDLRKDKDGWFILKEYGGLEVHFLRVILLLHRIFNKWDFSIKTKDGKIPTYKGSATTMMVFKLINFKKSNTIFKNP